VQREDSINLNEVKQIYCEIIWEREPSLGDHIQQIWDREMTKGDLGVISTALNTLLSLGHVQQCRHLLSI
jgi:hypothetical protein